MFLLPLDAISRSIHSLNLQQSTAVIKELVFAWYVLQRQFLTFFASKNDLVPYDNLIEDLPAHVSPVTAANAVMAVNESR